MKDEWQTLATNIIKAELARRGVGYNDLQQKLASIGINETANSINVKINRGSFSFIFFLQIMKAINAKVNIE